MMWIFGLLLAALAALLTVLLVRAALAGKGGAAPAAAPAPVLPAKDSAAEHLAQLVRIPTVSSYDEAAVDTAQFEAYRALVRQLYPGVHGACREIACGEKSLLLHWKGKQSSAPTVLMAHFDVVPVEAEKWQHPPFCGEIFEGELWGRGTLDTKITMLGMLEAAEALLAQGYVPAQDVYFAFGADEEVNGHGATDIIAWFAANGVTPALVLDEGGAVVENVFPGIHRPIAVIGIGEKGLMNVELTAKSQGGHASQPVLPSTLGLLCRAIVACEGRPFRAHLTTPVREMLRTLTPHLPFGLRILTANLWCFGGLLCCLAGKLGGEVNAMMRTTMAFTMAKGSQQINVMPTEATAGLNLRLVNLDTPETVLEHLRHCIGDERVTVRATLAQPASPYAPTEGAHWEALRSAVSDTWPGCIVSPYLMIACSDSRHYAGVCEHVYKFSAMALSKQQRALIHTHNERIPVTEIPKTVAFFSRLLQML